MRHQEDDGEWATKSKQSCKMFIFDSQGERNEKDNKIDEVSKLYTKS